MKERKKEINEKNRKPLNIKKENMGNEIKGMKMNERKPGIQKREERRENDLQKKEICLSHITLPCLPLISSFIYFLFFSLSFLRFFSYFHFSCFIFSCYFRRLFSV